MPTTVPESTNDLYKLNSLVLQLQTDLQRTQAQLQTALTDLQTSKAQQGLVAVEITTLRTEMNALKNQPISAKPSSGVATKIPDVSFQVSDPPSHVLSSTPVKFNTVAYNAGSGYNSGTGKFTAPVKGTYMFWTQLEMGGGSNTALYVYIKRTGGINMAAGYMETGSSFGDMDASAQALGHLEQGQEVWVEVTTEYDIYHSASYFGGALISQG